MAGGSHVLVGYMGAGGHTNTRGEASRVGGGSEGFFRGARYFYFSLFLCFLVGSGAASDRPASAGRGWQERSVSSSP